MATVTLELAQKDLPDLIKRALDGEEIIIANEGQAPVRLAPMTFDEAKARRRGFGVLRDKLVVGPEFFEPLPDEELKYWEGRGDDEATSRHSRAALVAPRRFASSTRA